MSDYMDNNGALDWDGVLEGDGQEFITLPEGDYIFTVTNFERGRFPGSAKIGPCNKATLNLQVKTDAGVANVKADLILHQKMEWQLSAFFRCIGQKKRGERLVMNWNAVPGACGRAHFKPRTYTDREGNERQVNDVDKYYDWDEGYMTPEVVMKPLDDEHDELPF